MPLSITDSAALTNSRMDGRELARIRPSGCWSNGLLATRLRGADMTLDEGNAVLPRRASVSVKEGLTRARFFGRRVQPWVDPAGTSQYFVKDRSSASSWG
jgi:hypothetical protein